MEGGFAIPFQINGLDVQPFDRFQKLPDIRRHSPAPIAPGRGSEGGNRLSWC